MQLRALSSARESSVAGRNATGALPRQRIQSPQRWGVGARQGAVSAGLAIGRIGVRGQAQATGEGASVWHRKGFEGGNARRGLLCSATLCYSTTVAAGLYYTTSTDPGIEGSCSYAGPGVQHRSSCPRSIAGGLLGRLGQPHCVISSNCSGSGPAFLVLSFSCVSSCTGHWRMCSTWYFARASALPPCRGVGGPPIWPLRLGVRALYFLSQTKARIAVLHAPRGCHHAAMQLSVV